MSSVEKLSNDLYVNHFYMSYYKEKENYKKKNLNTVLQNYKFKYF